jgi:hypothetical protein
MSAVRRLVVVALLLVFVGAGAALAARGDPQKKINPADQARAKAMLLRKADFPPTFKSTPPSGDEFDFYCKALDESDLTLTGEAESPDFTRETASVFWSAASVAQVYATVAQANASWRRETSAAGQKCGAEGFQRLAREEGFQFISYRRISFPSVAPRSAAYRVLGSENGVRIYFDVVWMMRSRAQTDVVF